MERVPGLDFLRALAILLVMWFHALNLGADAPLGVVARYGWMGVDIFFALSGYLIGWQLFKPLAEGRPVSLSDFYWRRAFRILPAYFAVLAIYFGFPVLREAPGIQPLWQFLTFTEGLLIDYTANQAFSHVWSLCVEEHFYLVLPGLCLLLAPWLNARRAMLLCLAVLLTGIGLRALFWYQDLVPLRISTPLPEIFYTRYIETIYYPTYTRLDGLLGGIIVALIRAFRPNIWQGLARHSGKVLVAGILGSGVSVALFSDRFGLIPCLLGFPLMSFSFATLVAAAALPGSWLGGLKIPGAHRLAAMSFSLYLSHKVAIRAVGLVFHREGEVQGLLRFGLCALVALLLGMTLYFLVEKPCLELRDRFLAYRRNSALSVTEPA